MASQQRSSGKKARKNNNSIDNPTEHGFKNVRPMNYIQEEYLNAIYDNDVVLGIGSAGTGKTYVAATYAAGELYHKRIDKIVLTRPNVETGRGLGFLPGELDEKYAPYLMPFEEIFKRSLGEGFYSYARNKGYIDPQPLGFMRGSTFSDCIVLADEMQNATKEEMKMLLSRIGNNCKMIISGDHEQKDIEDSGLEDAAKRLSDIDGIEVVRFRDEDIVRSGMCKKIIMAYRKA